MHLRIQGYLALAARTRIGVDALKHLFKVRIGKDKRIRII
jgi:hypothetical protein